VGHSQHTACAYAVCCESATASHRLVALKGPTRQRVLRRLPRHGRAGVWLLGSSLPCARHGDRQIAANAERPRGSNQLIRVAVVRIRLHRQRQQNGMGTIFVDGQSKDNFAQHCCCPFTRLSRWSPLDVELIHVSRLSKNEHPLRTELDSSCISAAFGARSPLVSRNSKPLVHLVV
jgi:hypothetical protein